MGVTLLEASAKTHLRSLTGLRFFAAFGVVLYHLAKQFPALNGMDPITGYGYAGVSFFFMLSGFVLAWSYRGDVTAVQFYWRRFARVWPLHALTTGLAFVVAVVLGLQMSWGSLPLVGLMAHAWVPDPETYFAFNTVSWSLSAEAFFYLMFPLLFMLVGKRRRVLRFAALTLIVMLIVAVGILALTSRPLANFLLYIFPAYRVGEFIVGICLALAIKRGWRPFFGLMQAVAATVFGYVMIVVAATFFDVSTTGLPPFVADLWLVPGFAAVIAAAAHSDICDGNGISIFRSAPVVKLGQWSFALYLVHQMVFRLTDPLWGRADTALAAVGGVLAIAISIGLSALLYECVERPTEKLLRGLIPRRGQSRAGLTSPSHRVDENIR